MGFPERRGPGDRGLGLCGLGRGVCWGASWRGGLSGRRCGLGLCVCEDFFLGGLDVVRFVGWFWFWVEWFCVAFWGCCLCR